MLRECDTGYQYQLGDGYSKISHLLFMDDLKHHTKRSELWYQHMAEPVIETESVKILWDMNIQTDHVIEHR